MIQNEIRCSMSSRSPILGIRQLWRFLAALHLNVAMQILSVHQQMRERVWAAANVRLSVATLDTDTTVHTLYGKQMGDGRATTPRTKARRAISRS